MLLCVIYAQKDPRGGIWSEPSRRGQRIFTFPREHRMDRELNVVARKIGGVYYGASIATAMIFALASCCEFVVGLEKYDEFIANRWV